MKRNKADLELIGHALDLIEPLCMQMDYDLVIDYCENKASVIDISTKQFMLSASSETWIDALFILYSKLQISLDILRQRKLP